MNLEEFEAAADGYHLLSSTARAAKDELSNSIIAKTMPDPEPGDADSGQGLVGQAATAAHERLSRLSKNFHYTQVECGLLGASFNAVATELRAVRKKLDTVLAEAESAGLTVRDDGSVSYPPAGREIDGKTPEGGFTRGFTDPTAKGVAAQAAYLTPNPKAELAQQCADDIANAVREASEIDERWSPKIERLKAQKDLAITAKDWANVHGDQRAVQKVADEYLERESIPEGKTPGENAKWWQSLSAQEKADYVSLYPASIGSLDGLPAEVRDEANRAVLAEKKGAYELQLASMPPEPWPKYLNGGGRAGMVHSTEWLEWHNRREQLENSLMGIRSIQDRFSNTGKNGLPDAYLLGFSPEGNGRAIIANGNPDTADHIAVYVPGTTARLENIQGDMDRMNALWRQSQSISGADDVSTITWLGYDAPQDVVTDAPLASYANEGAPSLNRFLNGLDETNGSQHRTTIGHSYGTTLIGSAARQNELSTDDVILVGSPGVQVGSSSEMDVPAGNVWNQDAEGDYVPEIGRWGHGGSSWEIGGGTLIIPSDQEFGAKQLSTDTRGHSDYWNKGSQSLYNQAAVVTGKSREVILDQ
ncbi:alpha/beta hydrolase [Streptomyces oceani]|uniref:alpha/beta hydrolase n=1 Tax=Streptomyces oceani TaxID=1075402 RepID=UPI001FCD6C16|nr:alpha/beta hydrolase [Streptomyces oceani]